MTLSRLGVGALEDCCRGARRLRSRPAEPGDVSRLVSFEQVAARRRGCLACQWGCITLSCRLRGPWRAAMVNFLAALSTQCERHANS